jgi:glutathione S-transferase
LSRQSNGKVPFLEGGDLRIFESGAILLYMVNNDDKEYRIWESFKYL